MSRASDALRDATERGRRYRMNVHWTASDFERIPFSEVVPTCACGCRHALRGAVERFDGRTFLAGHAANPATEVA